ncbi:MAG: hypothetical protein ACR2KK_03955 [Acidimicrobiales bacterium]
MPFDLTDNVNAESDEGGGARSLEHIQEPYSAESGGALAAAAPTPQALVANYLNEPEVKRAYGLGDGMIDDLSGARLAAGEASTEGDKLRLGEEKSMIGTTSISYEQTYNGMQVWEAGVNVTVHEEPLRVTSSYSSVHQDVSVANEDGLAGGDSLEDLTPARVKEILGLPKGANLTINGTRSLVYRYRSDYRHHPETAEPQEALQSPPPTLPLPPVPDSIVEGTHYIVHEVLFSLPVEGWGPLNWRAFVEPTTGAVLYVRAFVAAATASVFRADPPTTTGNMGMPPTAGDAVLNPLRSSVALEGLTPPPAGQPQALSGEFVQIVNISAPSVPAPVEPPPSVFLYSASTDNFAAVNAYHHCDWLFRLVEGMGFNMANYWNGTSFPVPVDHRATVGMSCPNGVCVNAQAPGNASGTGSDGFRFALAAVPSNGQTTVGIAADLRVVLHEFGHAILWDSVHSPNFGFAHSAGDSLAAVLLDPDSQLRNAPERFATFPWELPNRRHDRDVTAGWAWGGSNDIGGYSSEQILSTTHFRLYRSIGGDSLSTARRRTAAREVAYLIIRATGLLAGGRITPTPNPGVWATTVMNADVGTVSFEGYRGGAYHKVVRWAFEKQGLYQPPLTPAPVTQVGAPPAVDVFIDDGRDGEYQWQPNFWSTADIWNRLAADGGTAHQTPIVGVPNHAYVRVKNRGTQAASNVVVRGYHCKPAAGLVWPGDWEAMTTAQVSVAGSIPAGGQAVAGPFEWTPEVEGHECLLMAASATGDPSNIDPGSALPCAAGPTPEWRLVPFDNNLGQRNLAPVAGGGGLKGLTASFLKRRFWVKNPFDHRVKIKLETTLPTVLAERGWKVAFKGATGSFTLAPGAEREVRISLVPGRDITPDDVKADRTRTIDVRVVADGVVLGGMSYLLDPKLRRPPVERKAKRPLPKPNRPTGFDDDPTADRDDDLPEDDLPDDVEDAAVALLEQLNIPVAGVERVTITRVSLDIDLTDQ